MSAAVGLRSGRRRRRQRRDHFAPRVSIRRFAPSVAAGVGAAGCGLGLLATSGWLITRASQRPPILTLSIAIGAVQAFALGRGIFRYLQRLGVHELALSVLGSLRLNLYDTLEPLVPGGLGQKGVGAATTGLVADAELVAEGFAKRTTATVDVAASVALGAGLALFLQPELAAVVFAGACVVVLVSLASARLGRPGAEKEAVLRGELADAVVETLRAAHELAAYGREDLLEERLAELRRRSISAALRRALSIGLGRGASILFAGGAFVALVGAGLHLHGAGRLSGVMLAVLAFVGLFVFDQLVSLALVLGDLDTARSASDRLGDLALLAVPCPEPAVEEALQKGRLEAALEGADVTIEDTVVLSEVSLKAGPGRRLAICGPSGSGKSTALHALLHFVSCSAGRASLGGVDVSRLSRQGIARHLAWMADDTYLFAATVADNLRVGRRAATDEELFEALDGVGLRAWLEALPEGLSTCLGSGGLPVSAGERQRLGMARALLGKAAVLLLDEPTAHLDPESAPQVLFELLGAAGDHSVIVVSHEPGVARHVDEVVTLKDGRVLQRDLNGSSAGS